MSMTNINEFIICPKCHRMYDERVLKCEACGFEHPPVPAEAVQLTEDDVEQQAEADAINNVTPPNG